MTKFLRNHFQFQKNAIFSYLTLGPLAAIFTLLPQFASMELGLILKNYPFGLTFILSSVVYSLFSRPYHFGLILENALSRFLLIQYFLLLGFSMELGSLSILLSSTLPICTGLLVIQFDWNLSSKQKRLRSGATVVLALMTLYLPFGHAQLDFSWSRLFGVYSFFLWQVGGPYLINIGAINFGRVKNIGKLKLERTNHDSVAHLNRDRFFFHDLVNHTHGMGLYLKNRILKEEGLTSQEVKSFSDEILNLQNLIQNHFGLKHKNLGIAKESEKVALLLPRVKSLAENFMAPTIEVTIINHIEDELQNNDDLKNTFLNSSAFLRIMTNLIKNCSEANPNRVDISFSLETEREDAGLILSLKNDIYRKRPQGYELGEAMANVISMPDKKGDGLGLASIEALCFEQGGEFKFKIEDGVWKSEVFLPFLDENGQIVKNPKSLKVG